MRDADLRAPDEAWELRTRWGVGSANWGCAGLLALVAVASVTVRVLQAGHLEQTAALFIGLPTVLAIVLALSPHAKSATGMVLKGITLCLLASGILLYEGFICILMAAPLFYLVGLVIGLTVDILRRRRSGVLVFVPVVPLLFMSLEGTSDRLSFARDESVTATRIVEATPAGVEGALAATPRFDRPLPPFLRLRFPRPREARGSGLALGDRRIVDFAAAGDPPEVLVMEVMERRPRSASFVCVSDRSMVAMWLAWQEADFAWTAEGGSRARVSLTLRYRRLLDPAWYFGPWERYGARLAAEHLLDTIATPRNATGVGRGRVPRRRVEWKR